MTKKLSSAIAKMNKTAAKLVADLAVITALVNVDAAPATTAPVGGAKRGRKPKVVEAAVVETPVETKKDKKIRKADKLAMKAEKHKKSKK